MTTILAAAVGVAACVGTWALLIWLIVTYGWMGVLIYLAIFMGIGFVASLIGSIVSAF